MTRTVEDMLRHFVSPTMTNWDDLLVHAQFAINNAWQESVQSPPFFLNHGRHPHTPLGASLERGRGHLQKVRIQPHLHLHCKCKALLLVPSVAC